MWRRTIASRILLAVLGILLATVVVGGLLEIRLTHRTFDRQYEDRALSVATVVANIPLVRQQVQTGDPRRQLQPLAERIARDAGASYVVITDRDGLRFSHPNPRLIGRRLEEPVATLDGRTTVGIDHGSLGTSANGKAPIFDARHRVVGQVSVGVVESAMSAAVDAQILAIVWYSALALAVGALVALVMARMVKRTTFGLEPSELASLLQDREAMLHGISEGVLGMDTKGRVTLVNEEARRLLHLDEDLVGRSVDDVVEPGRIREILLGRTPADVEQAVLTDDALLVINRSPVVVAGRAVGSVVTLRDRTELEALVRELQTTIGTADALRAQEHEFSNRLHVVAGLIGLGEYEEAARFITASTQRHPVAGGDLRTRFAPAPLAALVSAKISVASERNVTLDIDPHAEVDVPAPVLDDVMTVIGNLVDNAIDAVAGQPAPRRVVLAVTGTATSITIMVGDNGPGLPDDTDSIFVDGFSTKQPRGRFTRGLGLALVRRTVRRRGGTITATSADGARFDVVLPVGADHEGRAVATRSVTS